VDDSPIPVTVVTGFLGAGKTTLLNEWLARSAKEDVAVVVNEFGAVGIDAELLQGRAREIREITGGCVCCTTYGELVSALGALASRRPKRIFVETSGAASPAGVVRAIASQEDLEIDGIVTVVDVTRVEELRALDLAMEQLGYADLIVLSRSDLASDSVVVAARHEVESRNPAAVVTTAREDLDALLSRRNADFLLPPSSTSHGEGIESIALSFDGEVDEERFGDFIEGDLARFAGRILRMKGIIAVAGVPDRMVLQGVADRLAVTFETRAPQGDGPFRAGRSTRLVVVGFGLDREALIRGFEGTKRLG
jgi:G3E family GTPase